MNKMSTTLSEYITEGEEQISDLEDKIVDITTAEQNQDKSMKRIEDRDRKSTRLNSSH